MEIKTKEKEAPFFNGAYGFVIKPDGKTQEFAKALALNLAPEAEYLATTPHITLYHAKFENLPAGKVRALLQDMKSVEGRVLNMGRVYVFGGKFIFWDVENRDAIRATHEKALIASEFLDRKAVAKSIEEGLDLTKEESANIEKYGHPLVLEKFMPHITLAYDSHGISLPGGVNERKLEMKIESVNFAEMGKYGSVAKVVNI